MLLWTAYFLNHAMPADLLSNFDTRKHIFAAGICAWLLPMWIVIIYYRLKIFS